MVGDNEASMANVDRSAAVITSNEWRATNQKHLIA